MSDCRFGVSPVNYLDPHPEGARSLIFGRTLRLLPFRTSDVRRAKALARLRGYAGSSELSLVAYVISTMISRACSFYCFFKFAMEMTIFNSLVEKQHFDCCAVSIAFMSLKRVYFCD